MVWLRPAPGYGLPPISFEIAATIPPLSLVVLVGGSKERALPGRPFTDEPRPAGSRE